MGKSTGKHMSNMKAYNGYKAKHMKVVARKKIDKRIIRQIGLMILLSTISIIQKNRRYCTHQYLRAFYIIKITTHHFFLNYIYCIMFEDFHMLFLRLLPKV